VVKAKTEPTRLIQMALYGKESHRAILFEVGKGNLSAGLRALCEWYEQAKAAHETSEKES